MGRPTWKGNEVIDEYEKTYPGKVRVLTYPDNRHQGGAKKEELKAAVKGRCEG